MPAVSLTPLDLNPFADIELSKAEAMIEDAMALAAKAAPCIFDADFEFPEAAKAVIRSAVLRWNDAGTGVKSQQMAGPFGQSLDTRTQRRGMFWPSEIQSLQDLCQESTTSGAFGIDTVPNDLYMHSPTCALVFGATYCSCGASIAGYPLYGV